MPAQKEKQNASKSNKYKFGNEEELSMDNYSVEELHHYLAMVHQDCAKRNGKVCEKMTVYIDKIDTKITRNQDGLISGLKKYLNFNLDYYKKSDNSKHKIERLKLLYNYYLFLFNEGKNIRQASLFKNPTIENIDYSAINVLKTKNGKLLSKLKTDISQEVSPEFISKTNGICKEIVFAWQEVVKRSTNLLFSGNSTSDSYEKLIRINQGLSEIIDKLDSTTLTETYNHSLLETFYLKLVQHEQIGRLRDLIDNYDHIVVPDSTNWPATDEYNKMRVTLINIEGLEEYVRNNRNIIAKFVFNEIPTKDQYEKIDTLASQVLSVIDMFNGDNTQISFKKEGIVPLLLLISCFQELVEKGGDKKINNPYRGSSGKKLSIREEIKKGQNARIKSQMLITSRVYYRFLANRSSRKCAEKILDISKSVSEILLRIHKFPNLDDMCDIYKSYLE